MGFFNVLGDAFNRANETKEEIKSLSAEQIAERTFSASSQMEKEMYIKALTVRSLNRVESEFRIHRKEIS